MIRFGHRVIAYTEGLDQPSFVDSAMNYDATIRNIELIGEAAMHVPEHVREANPQIAWRKIIAMRNRLIHGYLGIDNDTLWSVVIDDVPILVRDLHAMLRPI
jgi:uncharacterized protein with HEPN domain